jgi:uncharacterized cofD-like protein
MPVHIMQKKIILICNSKCCAEIKGTLTQIRIPSAIAFTPGEVKKAISREDVACALFDNDSFSGDGDPRRSEVLDILRNSGKDFVFSSSAPSSGLIEEAKMTGASDFIAKPFNIREFILRINACYYQKKRIVCIGGGTGLFGTLMGLKKLPNVLLSSIVAMTDDGGSTGKLRESFGVLPAGDVRQNLVALANVPMLMSEVLQHRFKAGGEAFKGHNLGNLFLTALYEIKGSMKEGVRCFGDILNIQGIVVPVTDTYVHLNARFEDGMVISGESKIDKAEGRHPDLRIKDLWHEPKAECNIDAYSNILNTDLVVIGPGDLFTSVITNLIVEFIPEAIARTKAKKVYICNLMTKPGETAHYGVFEHVREIVKYLGGDHLDYVIVSKTKLSTRACRIYKARGQLPVSLREIKKIESVTKAKIIIADVGHETDLVRHDSEKIKEVVRKILKIRE